MDREPLLPFTNPKLKVGEEAVDESSDFLYALSPSELKDRIIFGPVSPPISDLPPSSSLFDALGLYSPRGSSSNSTNPVEDVETHVQEKYHFPKSNLHRSRTAPALAVIKDVMMEGSVPKPDSSSDSIVTQGFVLLVLYLLLGIAIYSFNRDKFAGTETHPVVDALYFCVVTMCTIGYGDITPNSAATKLFSILFVLVGFGFIDILLAGMVGYVLDLQESHLLRSMKRSPGQKDEGSYLVDVKKGRMRIRMKVALALGVVVLCIGIGVIVLHRVEHLGWLDSFYLSVMSVTTVGYGDRAFKSMTGRIFASIWLLVSTLAVARAFLYLAEARVDKRHRKMAKWVLAHDMSVSDFLAADIDNNGCVRYYIK